MPKINKNFLNTLKVVISLAVIFFLVPKEMQLVSILVVFLYALINTTANAFDQLSAQMRKNPTDLIPESNFREDLADYVLIISIVYSLTLFAIKSLL